MSAKIIQPVCSSDRSFTILDTRAPHFGHPATSFWTTGLYNSFMGLMGPIGLIGLIGVLDFSPVRFVRSVRCSPPFWTPFSLILDTPSAECFHGTYGCPGLLPCPFCPSCPHFGHSGHTSAKFFLTTKTQRHKEILFFILDTHFGHI